MASVTSRLIQLGRLIVEIGWRVLMAQHLPDAVTRIANAMGHELRALGRISH